MTPPLLWLLFQNLRWSPADQHAAARDTSKHQASTAVYKDHYHPLKEG